MKYRNPVVSGFYPDPSVCTDGKKYYLVNSTFEYFPGITLFESDDLVNWKQIGYCMTRQTQLPLDHAYPSGGLFAPTIRYNNGRFYMINTNVTDGGNFIIYTDDIYGEWSDPVYIKQRGIDPSLLFADDTCYFCGNGTGENGRQAVFVNEIVPETGENITEPRAVYYGNGGRFLEGPHIYKINNYYYLMAAEGGTEYGHMEIYARSTSPYGPYENYAKNPFLTNRNLGGYPIQGVGHADLIQNVKDGSWWIIHLAYRQLQQYLTFHTVGRETYLVPVTFDENGWFSAGFHEDFREEGTTRMFMEVDGLPEVTQPDSFHYTFENTSYGKEWQSLRRPLNDNAILTADSLSLKGTNNSIFDGYGTPAAIFIRQKEMHGTARVNISLIKGEAGMTVYMDNQDHYDIFLREKNGSVELVQRLCLGEIRHEQVAIPVESREATLKIDFETMSYSFEAKCDGKIEFLGTAQSKYLSTETCGGFVGNVFGLFAEPDSEAVFTDFDLIMDPLKYYNEFKTVNL